MRVERARFPAAGLLLLGGWLGAGGCAAPGPRGEIPLGHWSGQGTFVYQSWKAAGQKAEAAGPQSIQRSYPSTLSIRPAELDGRKIIELEVRSRRGRLPDLGDETHLKVALVKARRVSDSTVLYRIVGWLFNPGPQETYSYDQDAPPASASCITTGRTTSLQIRYADDFVDAYRFHRDRLEKTGLYFDADSGLIHWCEHLRRSR